MHSRDAFPSSFGTPSRRTADIAELPVLVAPTPADRARYASGNWYFMQAFGTVERELGAGRPVRVDTAGLPFNGQDLSAAARNYSLALAQHVPLELENLHPQTRFMLERLCQYRPLDGPRYDVARSPSEQ